MINSCSPARPHFYTLRADTLTQTHTLLTSSCWDKQTIKKWKEWVYLTVTRLYKPVTLCRALLNRTPPVNQLACAACCSGNAHGAKIAPHLSCPENSMNLGGYNSAGKHCTPFHKKVLITLNTSLIIYTLCVFWHFCKRTVWPTAVVQKARADQQSEVAVVCASLFYEMLNILQPWSRSCFVPNEA